METSEDRGNPSSKQFHYENNMTVERVPSNIKESFGSGASNTRYGRPEDTNVKMPMTIRQFQKSDKVRIHQDYTHVAEVGHRQKRKRDAIETLDRRDIPSSKQQQYKTNTTAGRTTSNTIETSEGGQAENCSEAIEDLNREMREVVHQSQSQLKKAIAEIAESIVEKISQQMEGDYQTGVFME
ncbi:uncharacterized protein LOC117319289 [Pecten maximus]|uniref:uncharacterized protein LOC117319289 n=1 Tax=Pecten maximus TaxID=6579 RepID=UPI0014585738|nr:uncharacterized protein LOC117319289 [Pecten maximus]